MFKAEFCKQSDQKEKVPILTEEKEIQWKFV